MYRIVLFAALALPLFAQNEELKLIRRVEPEYPRIAKQTGAKGIVELAIAVGTDGHVSAVKVLRGHPMLQAAAKDAVKQWVYEPPAAETILQVTVTFDSPDGAPKPEGAIQQAVLISRKDPIYPREAKEAGIVGAVALRAKIGKDGRVVSAQALSGPDVLRQAAIEAVEQWRYKPTMLNGEPVDTETTITLNFVGQR
jgi:TonB family protein